MALNDTISRVTKNNRLIYFEDDTYGLIDAEFFEDWK